MLDPSNKPLMHSTKHLILKKDSYKRSGTNRPRQTGINMRMLAGTGARRSIRRQEDLCRIFFVDQYSPTLFVAIVGIFFLCAIGALFTRFLLDHGAYEVNPLMDYLLNHVPYTFFVFKYGLTMIATCALFMFRGVVVRRLNVSTHSFLYLAAWLYVAIVGWELYLVYYVI